MTLPTRKFGVEVEFIGITRSAAAAAITAAGVPCNEERYGHSVPSQWKTVEDGSVSDSRGNRMNGGELVSPPLSGVEGLEQVRKVLRALSGAGATVNKTCGLHVHLDGAGLTPTDIARIFVNYRSHETLLNQMMPRSRVDNTYCKGLTNFYDMDGFLRRIQSPTLMGGRSALLHEAHRFDRYHTVNLASYARHGTIEFRQHSGSVNATKVTNWIQFLLYFVENARAMNQGSTQNAAVTSVPGTGARRRGRQTNYAARRAMWTLLSQANDRCYSTRPLTVLEVATVSGYSPATVNVLLSSLRNNRQAGGRIVRITTRANYGVRGNRRIVSVQVVDQERLDVWLGNAASVAAPATLVHDPRTGNGMVTLYAAFPGTVHTLFANMPSEIRGFYSERASDFGYEWDSTTGRSAASNW